MGLLVGGKLSLLKFVVYVVSQCIGAVAGAVILFGVTPEAVRGSLGSNGLAEGVKPVAGMVMELLMTMVLVLVVYASAVDSANKTAPMVAPLLIGLTVTVAHLVLMPYTGIIVLLLITIDKVAGSHVRRASSGDCVNVWATKFLVNCSAWAKAKTKALNY